MSKVIESTTEVRYTNLLESLTYLDGKPNIQPALEAGNVELKKVTLKAGLTLKCHQTDCQVVVIWLRGKACFTAGNEDFTMQPGSMIEMPSGTPHGAVAETDCVFMVVKIHAA